MFRHLIKALAPMKNRMWSAVSVEGGAGGSRSSSGATREQQLVASLRRSIPGITYVSVEDISGGCGAMFEISIEAKEFVGLSTVKQHRLVTDSLKNEIAEMHGIRIHTTAPVKSD